MKIYFPLYYKKFSCIADRCRHSCCVGWEIGVDDETVARYKELGEGERDEILSHLDDGGNMILCDGERCPFLRDDGLCRLIADYGDEYTSRICREHPRFYHRVGERVECGIGASCEEACRIILSSDNYGDFYTAEHNAEIADETDLDTLSHREYIYSVLANKSISYRTKLTEIKERYSLSDSLFECEHWNNTFYELEYLDEAHRELISVGKECGTEELYPYFERFFAYLVFRHMSVAESYEGLRARLGFCLLLLSVIENIASLSDSTFESICDAVRIISEEIEYSEDNTDNLIFEFECLI